MIKIKIDKLLLEKNMKVKELAELVGITPSNLSILKNGRASGVRFNTLNKICKALDCQSGDILIYEE